MISQQKVILVSSFILYFMLTSFILYSILSKPIPIVARDFHLLAFMFSGLAALITERSMEIENVK